jgi:homoserine O-acetyltransferase
VWGSDFPVITVGDMVTLQARLADHLGIARFAAITGGSMGGMQALEWSRRFPHRVSRVVAIASCARHDALQIAFNEIGRCAVTSDPAWAGGRYGAGRVPGLAVARMVGHVTYLSRASMEEKFGRRLQADDPPPARFAVQSYLDHQGESFIARFDPNAFLLLTRALDAFDWHPPALREISDPPRYRLISFTSDWLYPPEQSASLQDEITAAGGDCTWQNLDSAYGHDSFLIENPAFAQAMRHALDG